MARRLTVIEAAVLALGLSGCDEDFCTESIDHPSFAILVGLLCSGVEAPPENPPRAAFVMEPSVIDDGQTVRFDASASSDNGEEPRLATPLRASLGRHDRSPARARGCEGG